MHHQGHPAFGPLSGAVENPAGPDQVNVLLLFAAESSGVRKLRGGESYDPGLGRVAFCYTRIHLPWTDP
jgi:hypothetical protein